MKMLNLPPFAFKMREKEGKHQIYDVIRKKYVVVTPEEWVRQHFLHFLINYKGVSKNLVRIENGVKYLNQTNRSDVQVYDNNGNIWLLVECKAPEIRLNNTTIDQILTYQRTIKAPYLAITNGMEHYFFEVCKNGKLNNIEDIPSFEKIEN